MSIPLGYLIRILYAKEMTIEEYGLFYAILGFFGLIGTFNDLGFTHALNYYGTKFYEKRDNLRLNLTFFYAVILRFISVSIISLLVFLVSNFLANNYFHYAEAALYLKLFLIFFIFTNLFDTLSVIYNVKQKVYISKMLNFVRLTFTLIFSLGIFFVTEKMILAILSWASAYILITIITSLLIFREFTDMKFKLYFDKKLFKKLLTYAFPVLITLGANVLLTNIDIQMLTFFKNTVEVAFYSNAYSLTSMLVYAVTPISIVFVTLTAKLIENKKTKELKQLVTLTYNLILYLAVPIVILLSLFPKEILYLIFGSKYVPGYESLAILAIGAIFMIFVTINFSLLAGLGEVKRRTKIVYSAAVLNIVSNFLLIPIYGHVGAAITTTLIYVLMFALNLGFNSKYKLIDFNKKLILKIILANMVFFLIVIVLKELIDIHFLIKAGIIGSVAFGVYLVIGYLMKIYEIKKIIDFFELNDVVNHLNANLRRMRIIKRED